MKSFTLHSSLQSITGNDSSRLVYDLLVHIVHGATHTGLAVVGRTVRWRQF